MLILNNDILFVEIPRTGTDTITRCTGATRTKEERHISLEDYLKKHPEHQSFKKCSFVRNPFDRTASLYEHTKHFHPLEPEVENFDTFVEWYVSDKKSITREEIRKTQFQMLRTDGNISLDYIGRTESFEKYLNHFLQTFGIKKIFPVTINNKFKYSDYKKYYNDHTKKLITEFVKDDLNQWNYGY